MEDPVELLGEVFPVVCNSCEAIHPINEWVTNGGKCPNCNDQHKEGTVCEKQIVYLMNQYVK